MKLLLKIIFLFSSFILNASASPWKNGDVLLQSRRCYMCRLIESETAAPYSHMGLIVWSKGWKVIDALGKVRLINLDDFLREGDPAKVHLHLRPKLKRSLAWHDVEAFLGAGYDADFLWDNLGADGREIYYCSELITKILNPLLWDPLLPSPMDFSKHWNDWLRIFNGDPPQGKLGNSPADFYRSSEFILVGEVNAI